jgi:general secretion pathway protein A
MFEEYWGLKEKPFENTPDPKFLYRSPQHEEALSRLLYAIREKKPAAMLTGEYGAGKTLLSRVLLEELSKDRYKVALIFNPKISAIEFLQEITFQLGEEPVVSSSKRELLNSLNKILNNNFERYKDTIIVIDEAQSIEDNEIFEELRLLLNFQLNNATLLSLVLLGQPELIRKISSLPQFDQRIAIRYHLMHLNEQETREYILHRLSISAADRARVIFDEEAIKLISRASAGIPRMINNICDMCLLAGFGAKSAQINQDIAMDVIKDVEERYTVQKRG